MVVETGARGREWGEQKVALEARGKRVASHGGRRQAGQRYKRAGWKLALQNKTQGTAEGRDESRPCKLKTEEGDVKSPLQERSDLETFRASFKQEVEKC
jgi:hypothetical protein